jgi:hypothetical protein
MASPSSYYLRLLDARGELVQSFSPGSLTALVKLASEKVTDFDKYATVYRVLRLTGGLYARPFFSLPSPKARSKKTVVPLIVHIVSADVYHLDQKPI